MRRFLVLSLLLVALSASATTLQSLFYKAKEEFRLTAYANSLATLDKLQAESERPGNEADRAQLAPSLAFYRGACLAALGRADEARASFELFLTYRPNVSLDPAVYPRRVLTALDEARKSVQKPAPSAETRQPAETGSFATAYRAFKSKDIDRSDSGDETWSDGPVRYLLTAQQRVDYKRLSDAVSRSEFVTEFWKSCDPVPETPVNEFREEFERRVAFADMRLAQGETRGSLTDRGMLFTLLGPPTWVGRKPIAIGDDTADPQGMSRFSSNDMSLALKSTTSAAQAAAVVSEMSGPANTLPDSETSWREVWHYRRELLPSGVSYHQVDFEFITKKGYGEEVLQRDNEVLTTLDAAKSAARSGTLARKADQ